MRQTPGDSKYDQEELARLNAAPWQFDLLALNPDYVFWGPHEDYMMKNGDSGWDKPILRDSWPELISDLQLDELNEVVNFYFEVDRKSKKCPTCGGCGYHPDAQWVSESFYTCSSPFTKATVDEYRAEELLKGFGADFENTALGRNSFPPEEVLAKYSPAFREFCEAMRDGDGHWNDKITQDEVDALVSEGRLMDCTHEIVDGKWMLKNPPCHPTAEEVNSGQHERGPKALGIMHDSINSGILVRIRCERLGIPCTCDACEGHGHVFVSPTAHVNFVFWLIHPRKGASRGVEVKNIQESDLPSIFEFLQQAAKRNAERFAKVAEKLVLETK